MVEHSLSYIRTRIGKATPPNGTLASIEGVIDCGKSCFPVKERVVITIGRKYETAITTISPSGTRQQCRIVFQLYRLVDISPFRQHCCRFGALF